MSSLPNYHDIHIHIHVLRGATNRIHAAGDVSSKHLRYGSADSVNSPTGGLGSGAGVYHGECLPYY